MPPPSLPCPCILSFSGLACGGIQCIPPGAPDPHTASLFLVYYEEDAALCTAPLYPPPPLGYLVRDGVLLGLRKGKSLTGQKLLVAPLCSHPRGLSPCTHPSVAEYACSQLLLFAPSCSVLLLLASSCSLLLLFAPF